MIELNSKARKILEKYAHDLNPVVIVGGNGVTEGVAEKVEAELKAHELIKVKFNEFKDEKKDLAGDLSSQCDATLVRIIGNVAIFYKPAEEPKNRKYEKELNKVL
ncbi:MAG: ribosome assembly RNA-binding protein YhbY [Treponema sp.]|nr:ribosome assembly RNA-binding protein YhbY [Treponema sp.]